MGEHRTVKLYLCRHADAVHVEGLVDGDRWLTPKGRKQAHRVGKALARAEEAPELILSSPLVRAVQTAEGLATALGFAGPLEATRTLAPGGSLSAALAAIAEHPESPRSVYLVGHEPMMGEWASLLLGRPFPRAFVKGGVLRIDFRDEVEPGRGKAKFFLTPDMDEPEEL